MTDELRARDESERLESRNRREGDAAVFGLSITAALVTVSLAVINLTHVRAGRVVLPGLMIVSYIIGRFAERWHKKRD